MMKMLAFHCYISKKAILQHEFPDKYECGFWLFFKLLVCFGLFFHVNLWGTGKLLFPSETNSCLCVCFEKMLWAGPCINPGKYILADHKHIPCFSFCFVICTNILVCHLTSYEKLSGVILLFLNSHSSSLLWCKGLPYKLGKAGIHIVSCPRTSLIPFSSIEGPRKNIIFYLVIKVLDCLESGAYFSLRVASWLFFIIYIQQVELNIFPRSCS